MTGIWEKQSSARKYTIAFGKMMRKSKEKHNTMPWSILSTQSMHQMLVTKAPF